MKLFRFVLFKEKAKFEFTVVLYLAVLGDKSINQIVKSKKKILFLSTGSVLYSFFLNLNSFFLFAPFFRKQNHKIT